jgi:pre-mRNA-splicing factor SYF1
VLNYAAFLEEKGYFEDGFRAFERGLAAFPWPHARPLWLAYLEKFVARYGASKLERCRDLFENATTGCPPAEALPIYALYADFEERFGSTRHALAVLDRCTRAVDAEHLYEAFLAHIRKAEEFMGAPRAREIYERAVEALPDVQVKDMCLRFAAMETKLGEVERARAIFTHAGGFCDPSLHASFWAQWQAWELQHGTEETFRDMLRVKRSVAARFATGPAVLAGLTAAAAAQASPAGAAKKRARPDAAPSVGGLSTPSEGAGAMARFRAAAAK